MEKNDKLRKYAQDMRKNGTKEENTLWYQYLRSHPVRFRRQCVLGQYIVDFYCSKARLVIELDGSQHFDPDGVAYEAKRTQYLQSLGLKVVRFTNLDINQNLRGVCQQIDIEIAQRYCEEPLPEGIGRKAFTTLEHWEGRPLIRPCGAPCALRSTLSAALTAHRAVIHYRRLRFAYPREKVIGTEEK